MTRCYQGIVSLLLGALLAPALSLHAGVDHNQLFEQFQERVQSVVAVEFFVQHETEREPRDGIGLVVDDQGLIVLNENVVPGWLPPSQFKDFKVFIPGEDSDGYPAEYLGQDYRTGWHYIRAGETVREQLVPVTRYLTAELTLGESIWGIHLLPGDFKYESALLRSYVGLIRDMPDTMGFTAEEIGVTGSAVFNYDGAFVGWSGNSIPEDKIMYMGRESFNIALQSVRGTTVFLTADPFLERLGNVPEDPMGDPRPWIGVAGMEPLDEAVAEILDLEGRGAIVISDVIKGGPAEAAGLKSRDIVIEVDGQPLEKFLPNGVVLRHFDNLLRSREPGDEVQLTILRGGNPEPENLVITTVEAPTNFREADRQFFESLGFTIREFTVLDGINRRELSLEFTGVIAQFVKSNSPGASAGLQPGDWIKEIDGIEIKNYSQAAELLQGIVDDTNREEFVLLVSRNNETQVIRVKID